MRPPRAPADVPDIRPGDTRPKPVEPAPPTSLQALRYAGVTMIIALPVMIGGYKWFMG